MDNQLITSSKGISICKIFAASSDMVFLFHIPAKQGDLVIIPILTAPIIQTKDEDFLAQSTIRLQPCFHRWKQRQAVFLNVDSAAVKMGSAG